MKRHIESNTANKVYRKLINPVEEFMKMEAAGGIMLIVATIVALVWANSAWFESYFHFVHLHIGFSFGSFHIEKSLLHWVNDGLMVIFFYVVGLEIKRELVCGELSTPKKAAIPLFAAMGGMAVPALIYYSLNSSGIAVRGWGIPMATDIAFAIGILSLMGRRAPFSLKIFLLALAIIDDLGAVIVIAVFYTADLSTLALGAAAVVFIMTYIFRLAGIRSFSAYLVLGVIAWAAVLKSGVHATIAGVVLGFLTPHRPWYILDYALERIKEGSQKLVESMTITKNSGETRLSPNDSKYLHNLQEVTTHTESPMDSFIHLLHPWVSFFIMPVFAFVNAGVRVEGVSMEMLFGHSIFEGVFLGLFLGKPIGIMLACLLAVYFRVGQLPRGVNWWHILGAGFMAGIGFTMALFISGLALAVEPALEVYSKMGILCASLLASIIGSTILLIVTRKKLKT